MSWSHLLLVGGGHAQLAVLADCILYGLPCEQVTLLTPNSHLRYSGTVPGWIAGQYSRNEGLVDLAGLARTAGVTFFQARAQAIDPDARTVTTDTGEVLSFDIASFDTGGVGRAREVLGDDPRVIAVRPIEGLVERLGTQGVHDARRIAVVGGGAGGVELAFALRNRSQVEPAEVTLVAGIQGLVPDLSDTVRSKVRGELARQSIAVVEENAQIEAGVLMAGSRSLEPQDMIIAAIGSSAPEWVGAGGLACDADGFVMVDRHQRSTSHPHIFASGDVASRTDRKVPHSGVHAVHTGPVLAANLRAVLEGREPSETYRPRPAHLYLISTARGEAIASYGQFAWQGRLVAKLKHAIDMRWLASYAKLIEG